MTLLLLTIITSDAFERKCPELFVWCHVTFHAPPTNLHIVYLKSSCEIVTLVTSSNGGSDVFHSSNDFAKSTDIILLLTLIPSDVLRIVLIVFVTDSSLSICALLLCNDVWRLRNLFALCQASGLAYLVLWCYFELFQCFNESFFFFLEFIKLTVNFNWVFQSVINRV